MTEQELEKLFGMIDKLDSKTDKIYFGLYGVPDTDDKGMCGEVKELKEDYFRFKQRVMLVFCFLLGSGAIGVGVWELIKII